MEPRHPFYTVLMVIVSFIAALLIANKVPFSHPHLRTLTFWAIYGVLSFTAYFILENN